MVPLGVALISGLLPRGITIDRTLPISWAFVLGILLSISPLVLAFIYWLSEHLHGRTPSWVLFTGEGTVTRKTEETDLPEPTSLEFEDHFDLLMNDVLGKNENRRLILVIDNLDRVDAGDALDIWSTLQTFLQFERVSKEVWFNRLWIVVPYDPGGLRKLWESGNQEAPARGQPAGENSNQQTRGSQKVAESFIDKSFQIRFEVPPPVISNWRQYLRGLIVAALPKHEEEANEICRVYSLARPDYSPTPRELKLFVNQIGMVHRQWQNHIFPISHIAYYVLLKRRNLVVADAVINLPEPSMATLLSAKPQPLQESLAGLAFNVEPHLGMQIVLKERIFQAFTSGDPDELATLANGYPAGFWALLDDTANSELNEATPTQLEQAIRCSMGCSLLHTEKNSEASAPLLRQLGARSAATDIEWPDFNEDTGAALAKLAQASVNEHKIVAIADSVRRTSEARAETGVGEPVLNGVFSFVREMKHVDPNEALTHPFPVGCTAEEWIASAPTLIELDKSPDSLSVWPLIRPTAEPSEIAEGIAAIVTSGQATPDVVSIVRITHASALPVDWLPVIGACRNWLDHSQNQNGSAVGCALEILMWLRAEGGLETMRELVEQGHLLHSLHHSETKENLATVVRILVTMMFIDPSLAKPETLPGQATAGYQFLESFVVNDDESNKAKAQLLIDLLSKLSKTSLLFETISKRQRFDPLLACALRQIADTTAQCTEITTDFILSHWPEIDVVLNGTDDDDRMKKVLEQLIANTSMIEELLGAELSVGAASLYAKIISTTPIDEFVQACADFVPVVSKADWDSALRGENELLKLVLAVNETGSSPTMPHSYLDALVELVEKLMREEVSFSELLTAPIDAYELLNDENLKAEFRTRCANDMIGIGDNISDQFFDDFGEAMSVSEPFQNANAVSELFSHLVTRPHIRGLKWLRELLRRDPGLIDTAGKRIAKSFKSRIQEELRKELASEAHELLTQIARELGVKRPEADHTENDNARENETVEEDTGKP